MAATPPYVRLGPLLVRQHGIITSAQAEDAGVRRSTLRRMAGRGELERRFPGVYASAAFPDSADGRWMALQCTAGEVGAFSHGAAAHLLGLQYTGTKQRPMPELTFPRGHHVPDLPATVHTHVRFAAEHATVVDGWRVTTAAWTLAALMHRLGPVEGERAVGAALATESTTIQELAACIPRFRGCPGVATLRRIVLILDPSIRLTRSEAERLVLRLVLDAGLPRPEVNHRVVDAAGNVRELDLAWPEWGVCVEVDLHPSHDGSIGRHADGRRQNDLVDEWRVLRFDDADLQFDAEHVVVVIRRALARAGAPV